MSTEQEKTQGAQGSAPSNDSQGESKVVKHTVTETDIKNNPDLAKSGVKVGDEIEVPVDSKAKADEAEAKAKAAADAKGTKPSKKKYTVITPFADKDNFTKKWEEGDDVSHFDESRLESCISRGLVKKG